MKKLKKNWNEFGATDPLWAILTDPTKKGNRWNSDEFFKTGQDEIEQVMRYVETLGITFKKGKALDFGCGAGRLTQALAGHFDETFGVDVAPSMIEVAKQYNRYGEKCKYILNEEDNLSKFADNCFDFIYSNIALQHMKAKYSKKYLVEFLRILRPHGLLIFQQPSREKPRTTGQRWGMTMREIVRELLPSALIDFYRNKVQARKRQGPVMEMYEIRRKDVVALLEKNGATIIDISEDTNLSNNWISLRYCVTKGNANKIFKRIEMSLTQITWILPLGKRTVSMIVHMMRNIIKVIIKYIPLRLKGILRSMIMPRLEHLPNSPELFRGYYYLIKQPSLKRQQGGWIYRERFYPDYLTVGGASHAIFAKALKHCQGRGVDIGAGYWPLPGSIAVDTERGTGMENTLDDFADNSLDYVFSSHCLEHIDNWQEAVSIWIKKLKPNGAIFLYLPHPDCEIWHPGSPFVGDGHKWIPSPDIIKKAFQEFLCIIEQFDDGPDAMQSFYVCGRKKS